MKSKKPILFLSVAFLVSISVLSVLLNPVLRNVPAHIYLIATGQNDRLVEADFKNHKRLQMRLFDLLPYGTKTETLDQLLLSHSGVYRSDNLINGYSTNLPTAGTSSAHNYLYYYKPEHPSGNEGWENTTSGSVIFAIVDGREGLKSIRVLTAPDTQEDGKIDKHVSFVKELLQYKNDQKPFDLFVEEDWQQLLKTHASSPCLKNFNSGCLLNQVLKSYGIPDHFTEKAAPVFLADAAIREKDKDAAKMLLSIWPTADAVFEYENSIPRLRRYDDEIIKRLVEQSEYTRLHLLLLTGAYEEARDLLVSMQEKNKTGSDYGAIALLVEMEAFDQAYAFSRLTLEWRMEAPDPHENSSAHMHCENYSKPVPRVTGMGKLANSYSELGALDKAYDVANMIRQYWSNDAYGQTSHCLSSFAQSNYLSSMLAIISSYAKKNDKAQANKMADQLLGVLKAENKVVRRYNKWVFEKFAQTVSMYDLDVNYGDLLAFVGSVDNMDYPAVYNDTTNDPAPFIAALSGDYHRAIELVEGFKKIERTKNPDNPLDFMEDASEVDVKLTTYMKIVASLSQRKDKTGVILFLSAAEPYMGRREDKYDPQAGRLIDYVTKAEVLMDIGEQEKSRAELDRLISELRTIDATAFRKSYQTSDLFGRIATLYARHDHISSVTKFFTSFPHQYDAGYAVMIAKILIENGRWSEFDVYIPEMANIMTRSHRYSGYTYGITQALFEAKQYERFKTLINSIEEASVKNKGIADSESASRPLNPNFPFDKPEPRDAHIVKEMLDNIMVAALITDDVPNHTIDSFWLRYLDNCKALKLGQLKSEHRTRYRPEAKHIMAACYLSLLDNSHRYKSKAAVVASKN